MKSITQEDYGSIHSLQTETSEESPIPIPRPGLSQRTKAIIHMNIFAITCVFYQACAKQATQTESVNVIDLCLARTAINLLFAIVILNIYGKKVHVPKKVRPLILLRSMIGTVGFTTLVYSVEILPLFIV